MKKVSITVAFLFSIVVVQAQQSVQQLQQYMSQMQHGGFAGVPSEILQDEANALPLLGTLRSYYSDSLQNVRYEAYALSRRIGQRHARLEVRQQAIDALTGGLQDASSSIVGMAANGLGYFSPADFSSAARERLLASLRLEVPHKKTIAKLLGYLQVQESKPLLWDLTRDETLNRSGKWAAYLALARLGDAQALQYTLSRVRRLPVNDDVVYDYEVALREVRQWFRQGQGFEIITDTF